jgi:hypothetical protein
VQAYWKAINRILWYLKGTKSFAFECYIDVKWGGDLYKLKSTSTYVFLLNNSVISWNSKNIF